MEYPNNTPKVKIFMYLVQIVCRTVYDSRFFYN